MEVHSTSRSRACAISTLLRFGPVCTRVSAAAVPSPAAPPLGSYWLQAERLDDLDVESRRLLDGTGPPEDAGKRAVDLNRPTRVEAGHNAGPRMERPDTPGRGARQRLCLERQDLSKAC